MLTPSDWSNITMQVNKINNTLNRLIDRLIVVTSWFAFILGLLLIATVYRLLIK